MSASTGGSAFASHPAQRLTILLGARDHDHHGSLVVHLLQRARRAGLAGATAIEAYEGYGSSGNVHRTRALTVDSPVVILIVDQADRIQSFLRENADLLSDVLVTVSDVSVVEI